MNYSKYVFWFYVTLQIGASFSCKKSIEKHTNDVTLFSTISKDHSNIDFVNRIIETEEFNYFNYIYSYISGGVASADFNNDGLVDLFFTSGISENKLYINNGAFVFEDVTATSNIIKKPGFDMGVSVVDINNDGYLDIYICRGGWFKEEARFANLLYINNGDLTFKESAKEYGLADTNRSIASTFFDYDADGDLDVYISNNPNIIDNSTRRVIPLKELQNDPITVLLKGSDKLYNNDGMGHFTDVSIKAGILPDRGFGLNPQVGDLNNDGFLDVYVSNDFKIPDFAYINNGNGTFRESRNEMFKHISLSSMGSDIADINNDGLNDMIVVDMNPKDYARSKTTMNMISRKRFSEMVRKDYHYQYMHNVLQLNNGNGTFSEIGQMAGVASTDWSWAPLLADFDLDGFKDIFISNGVYRDLLDQDSNSTIRRLVRKIGRKPTKKELLAYSKMLPQQKLTNYFLKNNGNLTFSDKSEKWVNWKPTFSNGATYADLDNDGDLDLVISNINEPATILKNNAIETKKGNFMQFVFSGPPQNLNGIGVRVNLLFENGKMQTMQLINSRGYLSSVFNTLNFGLGKNKNVPKIKIIWPDGKSHIFFNTKANKIISVNYSDASLEEESVQNKTTLFNKIKSNYKHEEKLFDDYHLQLLLPHKLSQLGPAIAKSDINSDGIEDVFIGGAHLQEGQILLGTPTGNFINSDVEAFIEDSRFEDIGATFFDIENDGDDDLYVVSGSYEFSEEGDFLQDRIYINNGNGNFIKCESCLPEIKSAGSVVVAKDYDFDGDVDLFVGGRLTPNEYPFAPISYLLINESGKFSIQTPVLAPQLKNIGMVTDAQWNDIDLDGDIDLILTGEWMGIVVFENQSGKLVKTKHNKTLNEATGWWNKILIEDIDNDGDKDIIAGNLGLNYKSQVTKKNPLHIYTSDFDNNGTSDIVLAKNYKGTQVPIRGKSCMTEQMPYLKNKVITYNKFAEGNIESILGKKIKSALHYSASEFRSGVFIRQNDGTYQFSPFTIEAQKSPINSILLEDFDRDGIKDLLLAGNNYQSEIETTRADAGTGSFLKGIGEGNFLFVPNTETGFYADKDVRNMISLTTKNRKIIFIANNNDFHDIYTTKSNNSN